MKVRGNHGFPPKAKTASEPNRFEDSNASPGPKNREMCRFQPARALIQKLNFKVALKSAASAAFPNTKVQESRGA